MTRSLPPLNALRTFEAAARHLSFKKAAAELNVTPAAVSQQIKLLEDILGAQLFSRQTRTLRLSDAGQDTLPLFSEAFDLLEKASGRLRNSAKNKPLTISVSPSFGAIWLVPRLDRFYAAHPDIEIRIDGTDRRVDIARGEADLAIRYGSGDYPGTIIDHLFDQRNTPVCHPRLLDGPNALRTPDDLSKHTLLHVDWKDNDASWRMWLAAAGVTRVDPFRGPHFSAEEMAVQAAMDGQGVALVGDRLIANHLKKGDLVCPFDGDLKTSLKFSYYLLSPHHPKDPSKVDAFRRWLMAEAEMEVDA
jgi:LysR family glycine cleavage system transcriptional activator